MKLCLVIAEGRDMRRDVCRVVEKMGFLCAEADDGDFAYVAVQALMPDVIVLDCNHPEVDGPAFVEKIRNLKKGGAPVMLLCVDEEARRCAQAALSAAENSFVMKDFDPGTVAQMFAGLGLNGTHGLVTTRTVQ